MSKLENKGGRMKVVVVLTLKQSWCKYNRDELTFKKVKYVGIDSLGKFLEIRRKREVIHIPREHVFSFRKRRK